MCVYTCTQIHVRTHTFMHTQVFARVRAHARLCGPDAGQGLLFICGKASPLPREESVIPQGTYLIPIDTKQCLYLSNVLFFFFIKHGTLNSGFLSDSIRIYSILHKLWHATADAL